MQDKDEEDGGPLEGTASGRTPPYVSFKTFQTLLEELKTNGVPPQIDRSVLNRFAGGVQGQLMSAMKALRLLDDASRPTAALPPLVRAHDTPEFKPLLDALLRDVYPYVFQLDLMNATPSMFAKAFSDNADAKEDVLRKCRTFFLHAAKEADIPLGPRIQNAKFPRSRGNGTAKRAKPPKQPDPVIRAADAGSGGAVKSQVITEKALEYRLVDLMSDAMEDAEVLQAILKVVTFLKARDAAAKKSGG